MPFDPVSLGPVAVSVMFVRNKIELIDLIPRLADDARKPTPEAGRIVLIVPEQIRAVLNWPRNATPVPAIFEDSLVFRRAAGGILLPDSPHS